jgi:hypothetical protein
MPAPNWLCRLGSGQERWTAGIMAEAGIPEMLVHGDES